MKRVFDIDMQCCLNCGAGELKIIASILERPVIEKILSHVRPGPDVSRVEHWMTRRRDLAGHCGARARQCGN